VIRQAISCDICETEKRQTNHWFVAYEQAGELRVSGWTSRHRLRADAKHLCGQTCLHKLMDEFVAKSIASRAKSTIDENDAESPAVATDTSLTSPAAYRRIEPGEIESSARLMPPRPQLDTFVSISSEPRYASRPWHAEAWERERARELRTAENH
jgi:hypothetical protein